MFGRNKYQIYLSDDEYDLTVDYLIEFRNRLIREGRYTDGVDEMLIKVIDAKKKKVE